MAETKKKLPKNEWDFSKLNPDQVSFAFFYEYSRQSEKIKKLVDAYRELLAYGVSYDPEHEWLFSVEKIKHLSKQDETLLFSKTDQFKISEYLSLISWLSYCKKFPDTPFLELKPEDYLNGPEVPMNDRVFPVNGRGFCDIAYCWEKDFKDFDSDPNDRDTQAKIGRDFFRPRGVAEEGKDQITMHWIRVDWRKTDSELKEEIYEWIETYRELLKVKPISAASRGLLNRPLDLPKECRKKETALMHLGKLRCLEASGTWEKYLDIYDKMNRRYLERDVSAARAVLAWLESKV